MKYISARDAKNHFHEFLNKEQEYDGWLFTKITRTMERAEVGESKTYEHEEAMRLLRERLESRLS